MRSTLKSLAQFFQKPSAREFKRCFHLFESPSSSETLLNYFIYKSCLLVTEAVEFVCNGEKANSRDELYAN